jgi:hypothetical protein
MAQITAINSTSPLVVGGWRNGMTPSPENVDTEVDWERIMETHEIMYLVKRPSYEFCFAVPRRQTTRPGGERPIVQVRFKDQWQMPGLVLEIGEIRDFFEGLSRLMDYVHAEEVRCREQH